MRSDVTHADVVAALAYLSEQILSLEKKVEKLSRKLDSDVAEEEAEAEYFSNG